MSDCDQMLLKQLQIYKERIKRLESQAIPAPGNNKEDKNSNTLTSKSSNGLGSDVSATPKNIATAVSSSLETEDKTLLPTQNQAQKQDSIRTQSTQYAKEQQDNKLPKLKQPQARPVRSIIGIMSHDESPMEKERRQLIRDTYLSFYSAIKLRYHQIASSSNNYQMKTDLAKKLANQTATVHRILQKQENETELEHFICSLNDLLQGKLENPDLCRLAYAFVIAANPNGTTLLLNFNDTHPMIAPLAVDDPKITRESDAVYLNIKNNGNQGKTPTWFRYVTSVLNERSWTKDWDYIFKTDADNLFFPPKLLSFLERHSSKQPRPFRNVYGGGRINFRRCDKKHDPHCRLPPDDSWRGKFYMQGGSYFLSTDLAAVVSDPSKVTMHNITMFPDEDMLTGLLANAHSDKLDFIIDDGKYPFHVHPVKRHTVFVDKWITLVQKWLDEEDNAR
ncbi:hypothetical protein ACA910_005732 [Epithemia clementina (nom. ined.)]